MSIIELGLFRPMCASISRRDGWYPHSIAVAKM
jgi:hypothetical protein